MTIPWRKIIEDINKPGNYSAEYYSILAISGGVDSMFLLDFYKRNCQHKFCVAHFDHQLREDSHVARNYISNYCADKNIPYFEGIGSISEKVSSIEEEARNQRYEFLESIIPQIKKEYTLYAPRIVLAHHADDQVETVFLNLMRGRENLKMKKLDKLRFRPFLQIPKAVLTEEASKRKLVWFLDSSNYDNKFERNWLRNVIIPQLMERRNLLKTIGDVK